MSSGARLRNRREWSPQGRWRASGRATRRKKARGRSRTEYERRILRAYTDGHGLWAPLRRHSTATPATVKPWTAILAGVLLPSLERYALLRADLHPQNALPRAVSGQDPYGLYRKTCRGGRRTRERQETFHLLDGFEGKLTTSKWAAIAKCSLDTALRDISDLLVRGVLRKSDAGGRSTRYELNDPSE